MAPSRILASIRRAAGMTQAQLAKKIGLERSMVALVETDARLPSITTLTRWVTACGYAIHIVSVERRADIEWTGER